MKIKNLLFVAMFLMGTAPVMAQTTIDEAVKVIKGKGDVKEKEKAAKEALKEHKKDAKAICTIGRAYMEAKDLTKASEYAEKAIKANKNSAEGYLLRGDIAVMNDNPGLAASEYQNACYFDPKNPEGYRKYAYIYRGSDPGQAVEYLQKIREIDPTYPVDAEAGHIYYMAAKAKGKDYMQKALECYNKTDRSKLENSYLTEYALIAFASGKFQLAKEIAVEGLKKQPRNAGYNRLAMYNSVELKQYDDALNYADRLLNKSDSVEVSTNDYKYCALACMGAKKYGEAIDYFKKQLDITEGDDAKAGVYKNISDAYKENGDFNASVEYYEKYLNINTKATATDYANFANIYVGKAEKETGAAQTADIEKAVSVYKTMTEKFPKNATYGNFMAARALAVIDPDQKKGLAKSYYEAIMAAIDANGGVKDNREKSYAVTSLSYLGIYYFKIKNDSAAAKPYFEKLQQIDPENALAKQVLETYQQ